jgi:hypothetical protein
VCNFEQHICGGSIIKEVSIVKHQETRTLNDSWLEEMTGEIAV